MFMIQGTISILYVTDGTVNLLDGMRKRMVAAGMSAFIDGMPCSVANAAMISMYDGECAQYFGCYVNEKMVIGTFENVGFREGEEVKMVVTDIDDKTLFAHATVRIHDNLLWMPFSINKGRLGIARWIATLMSGIGLAGLAVLFIAQFFIKGFGSHLELLLYMVPTLVLIGGGLGYLTYRSSVQDGLYAEAIFRMLGFKIPWKVNISPYAEARLGTGASYQVYDLRKALRAYGAL